MRIAHISYSRRGGAGRVAQMLSEEMVNMGHESDFIYLSNSSLIRNFYRNPIIFLSAIVDNYLVRSRKSKSLFSVLRGNFVSKFDLSSFDVVHLHWTPGIFSFYDLFSISRKGKIIVWTLHDMWPFTGGCHHSFECERFTSSCVSCPQVNIPFQKLIKINFDRKVKYAEVNSNLRITAPSNWLLNKSKASRILGKYEHTKIENPIEEIWFQNKIDATRIIKVNNKTRKLVLGFSALNANLDSKGIYDYMNVLNDMKSKGILKIDFEFLIIGEFSRLYKHNNLTITGNVINTDSLIDVYKKMDILINPSFSENSPVNIIEAAALGIPSIVRRVGGMPELIHDGVNGFTFETIDESIEKISKLLELDLYVKASKNAHNLSRDNHSVTRIASNFLNLYLN
jgi:glycosyltransferase involved in cell wall biosynthesis